MDRQGLRRPIGPRGKKAEVGGNGLTQLRELLKQIYNIIIFIWSNKAIPAIKIIES